jgi:hypothetical protein
MGWRAHTVVGGLVSLALLAACALFLSGSLHPANAAEPCCHITGIDTVTSTVTAQESAGGRTFQFVVKDSLLLFSLKPGQKIHANFATRQVSIGAEESCCPIVSISAAVPKTPPAALTMAVAPLPVPLPKVSVVTSSATRGVVRNAGDWQARRVSAVVDGKPVDVEVLHLRGIRGIETAEGLPESAKQFLLAHARTLPPDDVAQYVVDKKMVERWAKTHSVPDSLKKKSASGSHAGCHSISVHCAGEAAKHAEGEASRQTEALRQQATDNWKHFSREAGRDLKMAEDATLKCFADHTLSSGPKRVAFTNGGVSADIPLDFPGKYGRVSGRARVGLRRVDLNADVEVEAFVIPCAFAVTSLPVWVRPKSVAINGTLTVASAVDVELRAQGQFQREVPITFPAPSVPPVPPIVFFIDEMPVEVDFGVEMTAAVSIDATGNVKFRADDEQTIPLNLICDGHGCRRRGEPPVLPAFRKPGGDVQMNAQGRVKITPSVYPGLRMDVNFGAITAKVGPELRVTADFRGVASIDCSATRANGAGATAAGLSADLYGAVDLKYVVEFVRPEVPGVASVAAAAISANKPGYLTLVKHQNLGSFAVTSPNAPCPK